MQFMQHLEIIPQNFWRKTKNAKPIPGRIIFSSAEWFLASFPLAPTWTDFYYHWFPFSILLFDSLRNKFPIGTFLTAKGGAIKNVRPLKYGKPHNNEPELLLLRELPFLIVSWH